MGRGGHRVHLGGDTRKTSEFPRGKEVTRRSTQGSCKPSTNVDAWRGFCHQLPEFSLDQRTSYAIHQAFVYHDTKAGLRSESTTHVPLSNHLLPPRLGLLPHLAG